MPDITVETTNPSSEAPKTLKNNKIIILNFIALSAFLAPWKEG